MHRQMLKSKIHRATITDCDVASFGAYEENPTVLLGGVSREQEALL